MKVISEYQPLSIQSRAKCRRPQRQTVELYSSKGITYYQQPSMELDDVGHSVAVLQRPFVGEVQVDGDAEVAADDDGCGEDEVEGEHGDDEREALGFHLAPGERAGQAEGLGAVPPPAQEGAQRPDQSVEPDPQTQHLHFTHADFLICEKKNLSFKMFLSLSKHPDPVHRGQMVWCFF